MDIIVHDLSGDIWLELFDGKKNNVKVISDNGKIRNCIGCFGCWVKTPGKCVLKDDYQNLGELLSKCSRLVIVSQCFYGSYSPFIRNILDRSISYSLPYFITRNGETHHKNRYDNKIDLSVHFYGDDITQAEQNTARELVSANSININASKSEMFFYKDVQAIKTS